MIGYISNIQRFSIHDGPGIRTTVFFQSCPLQCWWCHNPECMAIDGYAEKDNIERMSVKELMKEILKDKAFYQESNGGVTFSGGEPLAQAGFLCDILEEAKGSNIHTAIDTSGYTDRHNIWEIASLTDLFLYDLKLMDNDLHLKYTGVPNTLILKNLRFLDETGKKIIIRIPLIPEITDTANNITSIIDFLKSLKQTYTIDLLPYHKTAAGKYERLKIPYKLKGKNQSVSDITSVINLFKKNNLHVNI